MSEGSFLQAADEAMTMALAQLKVSAEKFEDNAPCSAFEHETMAAGMLRVAMALYLRAGVPERCAEAALTFGRTERATTLEFKRRTL